MPLNIVSRSQLKATSISICASQISIAQGKYQITNLKTDANSDGEFLPFSVLRPLT